MKLFIPEHLKNLTVIDQLYKMYLFYNDASFGYYIGPEKDSFGDYNFYMKSDPVRNFISMDFEISSKKDEILKLGLDYDSVIVYLTTLFYSVKGTKKVPEFALKYLSLKSFTYDIDSCEPEIKDDLNLPNPTEYLEALNKFCEALLYFRKFKLSGNPMSLVLEASEDSYVQTTTFGESTTETYKKLNVKGEEKK